MPPKKASATAKKSATTATHASYQDMIKEAVINLKERTGSSRQSVKKYVQANNNLGNPSELSFNNLFNKALKKGSDSGVFDRPKGDSGSIKLGSGKTAAAKAPAAKAPAAAKAKTTTAAATKKAPAKKAPAKKAATKAAPKAPAKKAPAAKSKTAANTSKARKTPVAAPAVEDKAPVVLGKTKSGRVTKSKAPQPVAKTIKPGKKAPAKKAAAKKATPKKK